MFMCWTRWTDLEKNLQAERPRSVVTLSEWWSDNAINGAYHTGWASLSLADGCDVIVLTYTNLQYQL